MDLAVSGFAAQHRAAFDLGPVVFGMVLNRLVDPKSKRACIEWLQADARFPKAEGWTLDPFYRALDVLHGHADELDDAILRQLQPRLSDEELSLLLIDTTSTYFESNDEDLERAQVEVRWREPSTPARATSRCCRDRKW